MLNELFAEFEAIHPLSHECRELLTEVLEECEFPKKHMLLRAKGTALKIYFLREGYMHSFVTNGVDGLTTWIFKPGDLCTLPKSFFTQTPSGEALETLTPCHALALSYPDLKRAYERFPAFATLITAYVHRRLYDVEECLLTFRTLNAEGRHKWLMERYPSYIDRIPATILADYIGMTPVMLSRVRNRR